MQDKILNLIAFQPIFADLRPPQDNVTPLVMAIALSVASMLTAYLLLSLIKRHLKKPE